MTVVVDLGTRARQAMIDIFQKRDATSIDRNFGEHFVQHDPNLVDGVIGMKSFAAKIASSSAADITIFRTLVDGDLVLLHSRYEGLEDTSTFLLAMDLFRFADDKIVEHWEVLSPIPPRDQWKNSNGPLTKHLRSLRPPSTRSDC